MESVLCVGGDKGGGAARSFGKFMVFVGHVLIKIMENCLKLNTSKAT